jgi:hypothetical protein
MNMQCVGSIGIFLTIVGSIILFIPLIFIKTTDVTSVFGTPLFSTEGLELSCPKYAKVFYHKRWRIFSYGATIVGLTLQFVASC